MRRNTDIECLRAIAVLGVCVHHMQGNLFQPGLSWLVRAQQYTDYWFGVDLFFAISGFVIASTLLPELAMYQGALRSQMRIIFAFWIRRAWRLLPSAWLWLGITLLAVLAFNRSGVFGSPQANFMATLAGIFDYANLRFAHTFFHSEYGASFVYWSLSLEEQFYFLLPLLALLLRRRIDALLIILVAAQIGLVRTPLLMSLRTDALALGVLLAIITPKTTYAAIAPHYLLRLGPARSIVPYALLALLAALASPLLAYWRFRIGAIAIVSAALVWIASYDLDYLFPHNKIQQCLLWIGKRSYAIYLIHIPAFFMLREAYYRLGLSPDSAGLSAVVSVILALAIIALLAELNHRFVEQPFRRYGRRISVRVLEQEHHIYSMPHAAPTSPTPTTAVRKSV